MSPIRLLNTLLLVAAITGAVMTYRAGRIRRELLAEQNRLEQLVGSLQVKDLTKMHVRALDTEEPLHFAWRVYFPANFASHWRSLGSSGSSSSRNTPRECVMRVRLRENHDGEIEVYTKECSGSSRSGLGNEALAELLRDRWDQIEVEQLGTDGTAVVEPDEIATLVRLTFSDSLKQDAREKLSKRDWHRYQSLLYEYRIGSKEAFEKADAAETARKK